MSTSAARIGQQRRPLVLRPSSRTANVSDSGFHGISQSKKHTNSVVGFSRRKSLSLGGGSKILEKSISQIPGQAIRVFDDDGNDVTPESLFEPDPGALQGKGSRFFLDEISAASLSEQMSATGSFSMHVSRSILGSSRKSSQSTIDSLDEDVEDMLTRLEKPVNFPEIQRKRDLGTKHVTDDMLKDFTHVVISETDIVSLLDIPTTMLSVDADDAKVAMERRSQVCKSQMGSKRRVDQSVQTLNEATKNKQVQSDYVVMVDAGNNVTTWDMYNTLISPDDHTECNSEPEVYDYSQAAVDTSRGAEKSMSEGSTASTASAASSLRESEAVGNYLNTGQLIMMSEKFKKSLLVMERTILANIFQPKLAAYRHLPVIKDKESELKHDTVEQIQGAESPPSPALEHLWTLRCELSKRHRVNSIAWNKKNTDLLAVGYGEFDSTHQKPGLVCCWSLKNPMWPDRTIYCQSAVTSLDFSSNHPNHLAVGMQDGTIAIYNVQSEDMSCIVSSRKCLNRHLDPVWQLKWKQQELNLTGKQTMESLFSVAADGRVSKWFVSSNGLDCLDVMKIKKTLNTKNAGGNKKEMKTDCIQSVLTPGLCFDFHPTDSNIYLVGTWEGLIHRCSCSNNQQFLESYRKHFSPVNCVAWCPFITDVFLSCSSDSTIQLWKCDHPKPILGLTSTKTSVYDIKWSPKWATVFGAINEERLEIWDLNYSLLDPIIVQPAATDVKLTSLLFATQTDCVLVGDSNGQVTFYHLKELGVAQCGQVNILEGIVHAAASSEL
ncbi:dynein axonemal intermediate chain 4 [Antennarius striatus]|uniref:dynein axonemal intermediate chain 4 n=1 Tax=Antennarius striatus TaxID=241820 RepID=UPI0035B385C9